MHRALITRRLAGQLAMAADGPRAAWLDAPMVLPRATRAQARTAVDR